MIFSSGRDQALIFINTPVPGSLVGTPCGIEKYDNDTTKKRDENEEEEEEENEWQRDNAR